MRGRIVHGSTPAELIREYTGAVGRMRELPAWALKGAIVGMQGGPDKVRKVWRQLETLDVPLSAFWLQV
jgi:alpha-glucosidase (family GH31 glycosyl hydrolase)